MALMYYFGDTPVQPDELKEQLSAGNLLLSTGAAADAAVHFREGTVRGNEFEAFRGEQFTPIGIGRPLSIEIMAVYTGNAPKKFLGGKRDVMLCSGTKGVHTQGASVRGLNLLRRKAEDHQFLQPSAWEEGSRIAFYTPALDTDAVHFSFELIADTFPQQTFTDVRNLFGQAAGLPVFTSAAPFLLAGSVVAGLIAKLGKALESDAFMSGGGTLEIRTPGEERAVARRMVVYDPTDANELKAYTPGRTDGPGTESQPALVHRQTGRVYTGDAPYLLINVDGRDQPALRNFVPKAATVAQLDRFYRSARPGGDAVRVMEEAMSLYNDMSYTRKIQAQTKVLEGIKDTNSPAYQNGKTLLDAYRKNLRNEAFVKLNTAS